MNALRFAAALIASTLIFNVGSAATPRTIAPKSPVSTAASTGDVLELYEKFKSARTKALEGELCIRSKTCPSDEMDYLRYAQEALQLQRRIESMAKKGNHDAAYIAGLIAYEQALRFDREFNRFNNTADVVYRKSSVRFIELVQRETKRAREFLSPAAKAMHPESCLLMGELIEFSNAGSKSPEALPYFYCAAREWHLKGNRELALRAYAGMRRNGPPQDPRLVEMHAKLIDARPANPWRPIDPSLRAGAASATVQ
jgi:TPR repeat protein